MPISPADSETAGTETDTSLGYQLIGGGGIAIAKEARLGVEYRGVSAKPISAS
jgi:hypothetical protein